MYAAAIDATINRQLQQIKMRERKTPKERKVEIIDAGIAVAENVGFGRVTRAAVATLAGCSPALVNAYFKTLPSLKAAILRAAIKRESLRVIGQAIAMGEPATRKLSEELRTRALDALR